MKQTKKTKNKIMFKDGDKRFSITRDEGDLDMSINIPETEADEPLFSAANVMSIIFWVKEIDPLNPGGYE